MNVKLKDFLTSVHADDYYWISVTTAERIVYYGRAHEVPEELGDLMVQSVYIDFESDALGIYVIWAKCTYISALFLTNIEIFGN